MLVCMNINTMIMVVVNSYSTVDFGLFGELEVLALSAQGDVRGNPKSEDRNECMHSIYSVPSPFLQLRIHSENGVLHSGWVSVPQ